MQYLTLSGALGAATEPDAHSHAEWFEPQALASLAAGEPPPPMIGARPTRAWADAPRDDIGWEMATRYLGILEPPIFPPADARLAAAAVIREPDGRVWVVCPDEGPQEGEGTFPSELAIGLSLQGAAIKAAHRATGLQVRLLRHLIDLRQGPVYVRYFLAERLSGSPAGMGRGVRALMLVPPATLKRVVTRPEDAPVLATLPGLQRPPRARPSRRR